MDSSNRVHNQGPRRSCRKVKQNTRFSPPPKDPAATNRGRKPKKDTQIVKDGKTQDRPASAGSLTCDRCGNKFVVESFMRGNSARRLAPKKVIDPETQRYLQLCYQCHTDFKQQQKSQKNTEEVQGALLREKEAYLREAKSFADSLVTSLGVNNAEKLYCPRFTSKPCRCIQTYLISGGRNENYRKRANFLLKLIKSAQKLSSEKCYDRSEALAKKGRTKVGLGHGQKRSKAYEEFVMRTRHQLKTEHNLCEMAVKKVLCYSNNFLFKRLKSEQRQCRVEKVKGRGIKDGGLMSIEDIGKWKCCSSYCSLVAVTHGMLLQEWRVRAAQGQSETRRVIAEMLTPSGMHTNCYQFIRQVLGVTSSVISSVNQHMRETGGSREPPPHGLRAYWEKNPRRRRHGRDDSDDEEETTREHSHRTVHTGFHEQSLELSSGQSFAKPEAAAVTIGHGNQGDVVAMAADGEMMSGIITTENGASVELVTYVNPDGTAQVIQVPVINCNSLVSDNIGQDVTLQLTTDSAHFSDSAQIELDSVSRPINLHSGTQMDNNILETVYVSQDAPLEPTQASQELGLTSGIEGLLNKDGKHSKTDQYSVVVGVDTGTFCEDTSTEDLVFTNGHMMDRFTLGQTYTEGLQTKVVDTLVTHETSNEGNSLTASNATVIDVEEKRTEETSMNTENTVCSKSSKVNSLLWKGASDCTKVMVDSTEFNAGIKDVQMSQTTDEKPQPLFVVVDKDKPGETLGEDQSKKDDDLENGPHRVIERAQQLIAESQRVVKKSSELAQQPLVQPSQITEQLQQLVGHSEKLVAQQHLTAVQLEKLTAAKSLHQLSTSGLPKKTQAVSAQSTLIPQPKMTAPIITTIPQQKLLTYLNPPASKILPSSSKLSIPTIPVLKRAPKRSHTLTKAQLLPSVAKRSSAKDSVKLKEKKTAFILPKKTQNESPGTVTSAVSCTSSTIDRTAVAAATCDSTRQVLVPVLGSGIALTVGMDNKGVPQLLVPCITTEKPETPQILPNQIPGKTVPNVGSGSYASRSNTIILQHPNVNGGSFSVQHVSDNVGVCFHPNSSVQGYVNFQGYGAPSRDGMIPSVPNVNTVASLRQAPTTLVQSNIHKVMSSSSDKQHLKELLPMFNENRDYVRRLTNS